MGKPNICIKLPEVIAEIKAYITAHPRISARKKKTTVQSPLIKHTMKITKRES